MSFLGAKDILPLSTVTAAGTPHRIPATIKQRLTVDLAQCLYVLTDDNFPAIREVRSEGGYLSCLLAIAKPEGTANGKEKEKDSKAVTLSVLAAGMYFMPYRLPLLANASSQVFFATSSPYPLRLSLPPLTSIGMSSFLFCSPLFPRYPCKRCPTACRNSSSVRYDSSSYLIQLVS